MGLFPYQAPWKYAVASLLGLFQNGPYADRISNVVMEVGDGYSPWLEPGWNSAIHQSTGTIWKQPTQVSPVAARHLSSSDLSFQPEKKSQEQIRKPSMVFSLHGSVALSLCTASAYGSEGGLAITGAPPPQASTFSIVPCPNSESLSGRNNISGPRDLGLVFHFWVR